MRSFQATSCRHFSLTIQLIVDLTCHKKLLQKNPGQYQKMEREIDKDENYWYNLMYEIEIKKASQAFYNVSVFRFVNQSMLTLAKLSTPILSLKYSNLTFLNSLVKISTNCFNEKKSWTPPH